MYEIKNIFGEVIYKSETAETLRDAVIDAVKARANLSCANFSCANLSCANFSCAYLSGADFSGANLSRANLSCANLSCANLSCANLSCANLSRADFSGAKYGNQNLIAYWAVGPIGSRGAYLQVFAFRDSERITAGCFGGTLRKFEAKVRATHKDNRHAQDYMAAIGMIKTLLKNARKELK